MEQCDAADGPGDDQPERPARPVGPSDPGSVVVVGVPVDDVTMAEAVAVITDMVAVGRASGRTHQVATVNVDFVVKAAADDDLRRILQRTDLSIADGMPIVWASRALGAPLRERVSGVDLVPALVAEAVQRHHRIVFFGGADESVGRALATLQAAHPGAEIVHVGAPLLDRDATTPAAVLDELRAQRPDVVCVALGNPKQERWIDRYRGEVGAPVMIGVGGTLDLLAGDLRRAPGWMQARGLEWVFRVLLEPRRLAGRYAKDVVMFGPLIAQQLVRGRRSKRHATVHEHVAGSPAVVIDVAGGARLDNRSINEAVRLARARRRCHRGSATVIVDGGRDLGAQVHRLRLDDLVVPRSTAEGDGAGDGAGEGEER